MKQINTNLGKAVIDFSNIEEAKRFAEQRGEDLRIFSLRDGHDLWEARGLSATELDLASWNWGLEAVDICRSGREYIELNPCPHEGQDLDEDEIVENNEWMAAVSRVAQAIDEQIHDGEIAVVYQSGGIEIIPAKAMLYHDCDVTTYAIGCVSK